MSNQPIKPVAILVVDDEMDVGQMFLQRYQKHVDEGTYVFQFASNGLEALTQIKENPEIGVVLLDLRMPELDGFGFLDRAKDFKNSMKTIIMTAYGDSMKIRGAMNRGAFDFLTKPLDFGDLDATLARAVLDSAQDEERKERLDRLTREKEILRRYFSDDVAEKIMKMDNRDRMIGENHHATVLFMDIRNFTQISEKLPPLQVAEFLNLLYPDIMELILGRSGSVNKLIGDAIVATFGVPFRTEKDALHAVEAAIAIRDYVIRFNGFKPDFLRDFPIRIGIGITTGPVFAGNIGSFRRLEYTVIGDTVNTASRLQNLTKKAEVDILIDGATLRDAGVQLQTREIRVRSIRGKTEKIDVYALMGVPTTRTGFTMF
ncbi:MAG: response regulator [Leptospirales bacterium]|nr:response regulator [Leptospirales bacterium]